MNNCPLCGFPVVFGNHSTCNEILISPLLLKLKATNLPSTSDSAGILRNFGSCQFRSIIRDISRMLRSANIIRSEILYHVVPEEPVSSAKVSLPIPPSAYGQIVMEQKLIFWPLIYVTEHRIIDESPANSSALWALESEKSLPDILLGFRSTVLVPKDGPAETGMVGSVDLLKPGHQIESGNARIIRIAKRLSKEAEQNPYRTVKAIYHFVDRIPEDEESNKAIFASSGLLVKDLSEIGTGAFSSLMHNRATCHGHAELMTALCRAAGIPARTCFITAPGARLHTICEVALDGKWIPVNPSGGENSP